MIKDDEIIEETETIPTNIIRKKITYKTKYFYVLLAFLLMKIINNAKLLIINSILCYRIRYQAKKKLLPYHVRNNKLNELLCGEMHHKNEK